MIEANDMPLSRQALLIQLARSCVDQFCDFINQVRSRPCRYVWSWPNKCCWISQLDIEADCVSLNQAAVYSQTILYLMPKRLAYSWDVLYAALARCWVVWIHFIQSSVSVIERGLLSYTRFANTTYASRTNTQVASLCIVGFFCVKHSQFIKGSFL